MATKIEMETWRDLAVPVLLNKQVVPMPPSTIAYIAAIAPADDTEAGLVHATVVLMFAQYESILVTMTPLRHEDNAEVVTLKQIYDALILL